MEVEPTVVDLTDAEEGVVVETAGEAIEVFESPVAPTEDVAVGDTPIEVGI